MDRSRRFQLLLLGLILVLAAGLRLYQLERADIITDEALIGFRSLGYIDFLASPYQTTPWEWFSVVPNWARLSFHDHPPLVFGLQHLSFLVFGENEIGLRLPFALAGVGCVALLYLVGSKLFNQQTGLISSALLAVSVDQVWVSRIGLQESIVIFFSLLMLYFFIQALETGRHWRWGIALGLGLLTKYTSIVLLPIIITYLLITRRSVFADKRFWLALLVSVAIFSPVLVYNLKLYQASGHFDLQFSYLFGQKVAAWQFLPGKIQVGSFVDRLRNLAPNLYRGLSIPISLLLIISGVAAGWLLTKKRLVDGGHSLLLVVLCLGFYLGLLLLVGPGERFVAMLVPFVMLLVAWFLARLRAGWRYGLVAGLLVGELFFTANTLLASYPIGQVGLTYSTLKTESYQWGYHQLNAYIGVLLAGKQPAASFDGRYQFLEDIKQQALKQAQKAGDKPASWLLVYDANMYDLATLWIFHRQLVYHGWPIVTADSYLEQSRGDWRQQGITDVYFFDVLDSTMLLQPPAQQTDGAARLVAQLGTTTPEIIKRPDGRAVFAVYHWQ